MKRPVVQDWEMRVNKQGPLPPERPELGPCWIYEGCLTSGGYGKIQVAYRTLSTHRLSYERHVGPIPDGLQIDHLCRVRACCNPAHLEAVPARENTRRSRAPSADNMQKTHCPAGHPYDVTYTTGGRSYRACRVCRAARARAAYHRQKVDAL